MNVSIDTESVSSLSLESDYLTKCRAQIARYVTAKDNNKAHLMPLVFTTDAMLMMQVHSENIDFPPQVIGCDNIADTLVRRFNENYENVYTFCFSDSLCILDSLNLSDNPGSADGRVTDAVLLDNSVGIRADKASESLHGGSLHHRQTSHRNTLSCLWLVCMVDKVNQQIKLGSGRYYWQFEPAEASLNAALPKVAKLTIAIAEMSILPIDQLEPIYQWVSQVDYPWGSIGDLFATVSVIDRLNGIASIDYLRQQMR